MGLGGGVVLPWMLGVAVLDGGGGAASPVQAINPAVLSTPIVSSVAPWWRRIRPPSMPSRVPMSAVNVRSVHKLWITLSRSSKGASSVHRVARPGRGSAQPARPSPATGAQQAETQRSPASGSPKRSPSSTHRWPRPDHPEKGRASHNDRTRISRPKRNRESRCCVPVLNNITGRADQRRSRESEGWSEPCRTHCVPPPP